MFEVKCTGCVSCANICPQKAITIEKNSEGFYIAQIDKNKCNHCNLCKQICPQCKDVKLDTPIKAFAVKCEDNVRMKSSSGGVFRILAEYILSLGGIVCGASFSDDFRKVEHVIISDKKDLYKLQGSKYLQSYINGEIYKKIKELLEIGKNVLFSGTPCQIAGLKAYLQKDYDNLISIDVLCHGTPSPKVWSKYLDAISLKGKTIKDLNFRNKKYGWGFSLTLTIKYNDNTEYEETSENDLYYRAFLNNLILNKACSECKYATYSRVGDISLGDFWNVYNYNNSLDDKKGISVVLVNSTKGMNIFNKCKNDFLFIEELSEEDAKGGNSILEHPFEPHVNRKIFFERLNNTDIITNITQCFNKKYDGIITNFWWSNNFGAIISAYAIQEFFRENGYNYSILNYIPYASLNSNFKSFKDNYLHLTHEVKSDEDFAELNNCTNNFVVGTDQVFRYEYIKYWLPLFTLSYTNFNKKRIAFSASFGKAEFDEANEQEKKNMKMLLRRFQAISTREKSGIKLCKKNFGIKAEHIIDPTFFVELKKWDEITKNIKMEVNPIVAYILDRNETTDKLCNSVCHKYNAGITYLSYENTTTEEFIYAIKNAKYFITDSFHGVCFAIIFNKPFICIKNKERGGDRFNSIQESFNIKSGFIDIENLTDNFEDLFAKYDYSYVQQVILQEKEKAKTWLDKNLNQKSLPLRIILSELTLQLLKCKAFLILKIITINTLLIAKIKNLITKIKTTLIKFKRTLRLLKWMYFD